MASCRPRSTTRHPIPRATWTTCRTRRAGLRSGWRCPTRLHSAGPTRSWSLVAGRAEVTAQEVADGLKEIMAARLGLPPEQLVPGARLVEDLGLDSLDAVELAISVERKFDIEVPEEELTKLKTVGDMVALVESRLPQAAG